MLLFIAGLFVGSFITIIIFSIMFAAKRGDQKMEMHQLPNDHTGQDKESK